MQKRKFDELVSYFNKEVSEMEIGTKYKTELLGMVTALGCAHEKEMSDLSEIKRDSSDLISRQAAIDAMSVINDSICEQQAIDALCELPSAQPERKNGEWILVKGSNGKDYHKCSECLHTQDITGVKNYCAVCGAQMGAEEEE